MKVVFLVSTGKKIVKILEKSPRAPPGKNPSDAHDYREGRGGNWLTV